MSKKLTLTQQDMRETLISNYDCIGKLDALKFIASIFPLNRQRLSDSVIAFNSIEQYK